MALSSVATLFWNLIIDCFQIKLGAVSTNEKNESRVNNLNTKRNALVSFPMKMISSSIS